MHARIDDLDLDRAVRARTDYLTVKRAGASDVEALSPSYHQRAANIMQARKDSLFRKPARRGMQLPKVPRVSEVGGREHSHLTANTVYTGTPPVAFSGVHRALAPRADPKWREIAHSGREYAIALGIRRPETYQGGEPRYSMTRRTRSTPEQATLD